MVIAGYAVCWVHMSSLGPGPSLKVSLEVAAQQLEKLQ